MKMIPLLDLGNVLVKVDFTPFLSWLGQTSGDAGRGPEILKSSLFYDLESGQIGRAEFANRVKVLYGAQIRAAELEERFCGVFPGLVDGIEPAIEELLATGPVYCLSNTNEIHLSYLRERFPLLGRLTRLFASHELKMRKPYPGVYRDVARALDLNPRQLVFFDDVMANVEGAKRAGLGAHLFAGAASLAATMATAGRGPLKGKRDLDDTANTGELP